MSQSTILMVDDERGIVDAVSAHFETIGITVEAAYDGNEGLSKALSKKYDVIILDINLPGIDGLELCRALREKDKKVRILMLSTRGEEIDKVVGLEVGADDYLTKPFGVRELSARVKVMLRRVSEDNEVTPTQPKDLLFGNLRISPYSRQAFLAEQDLELSPTEYDLLFFLAKHPGRAFSRSELLSGVWGYDSANYERVVTTCINRLRAKLGDDSDSSRYVQTVRGLGYRFGQQDD